MLKRHTFWLTVATVFQLFTAIAHSLSFFVEPKATNDSERLLLDLMKNYRSDMGAGFSPSTSEIMTALSSCFTLVCLLGGLTNWYLLRKKVDATLLGGLINIHLLVFGACFAIMAFFTFLPPIALTGLIFAGLLATRVTLPSKGTDN
jgi:hypothetical protein